MAKSIIGRFLLRWFVSSLGLYVAMALLGHRHLDVQGNWDELLIAGLIMALVNMAVKPILIMVSFPAIILSLGLFMLVINGLLVLFVSWLYPVLEVSGLGAAILTGVIIGLVNYLVTRILEDKK